MSTHADSIPAPASEHVVAMGAIVALGCGMVAALAGLAMRNVPLALAGGFAASTAFVIMVSADWIDGLLILALSLPLPALYSNDSLRIAAAAPINALFIAGWLLYVGARGRRIHFGTLPVRATALLLGAFFITTLLSPHQVTSLRELINFSVQVALLFAATDLFSRDPRRIDRVIDAFVALAAVCGIAAVAQSIGLIPSDFPRWGTSLFRADLGFGQPNELGLFFATILPLAVHRAATGKSLAARAWGTAAIIATTLGLVATFSRGSWLAVLAGTSVLLFAKDRRFVFKIVVATVIATVLIDVASGGILTDTAQRTLTDWVIEQRAALMLAGVMMFLAHPIIGVGPGGFAIELDTFGAQIPRLFDYLPQPHNAYVQMAAESGIIGLFTFVGFCAACIVVLVRRARRAHQAESSTAEELSLRRALLWSFATACFAGLVVWPFAHGTGQVIMLIAAAGFAVKTSANRDPAASES